MRKSSIYVFDNIFADIGDNQSIISSLSTFSSHMLNIIDIINNATSNSLILVDELGSGTSPSEGANLAISILEYFNNLGSLVVATTHYKELKNFVLETNGFENACVEFNIKTLKPTYNLLIGIPGQSNAFEISQNLGLPEKIISRAKNLMSKDEVHIEELLKNIYDSKVIAEKNRKEATKALKDASKLKAQIEEDSLKLKESKKEIIEKAKLQARDILLNAKEELQEILDSKNKSSKDLNELRNTLNKNIKDLSSSKKIIKGKIIDRKDIHQGLEVYVNTLGKKGTIISNISKDNEVQVQVGIFKTSVKISDLSPVKSSSQKHKNTVNYANPSKVQNASSELNIIGMNVEESILIVDKFLDDAVLSKLNTVRIVHGKGTRKIKKWNTSIFKEKCTCKKF